MQNVTGRELSSDPLPISGIKGNGRNRSVRRDPADMPSWADRDDIMAARFQSRRYPEHLSLHPAGGSQVIGADYRHLHISSFSFDPSANWLAPCAIALDRLG